MSSSFTPEEFAESRHHRLLRLMDAHHHTWLAQSTAGTYQAIELLERRYFETQCWYDREYREVYDFAPISRTHESLVPILELGRDDEAEYFYYVMELADDQKNGRQINSASYRPRTLREMVAGNPRPDFAEWLNVCVALTSAIRCLHEHGLIHRDLNPSMILFVNAKPKLGGIGVSTKADSFPYGTCGYIPPEGNSTPQANIYSLGKVIYELATGQDRDAFPTLPENWGADGGEIRKLRRLNEIILKACAHDPRKRYQSAGEMQDDLLRLS